MGDKKKKYQSENKPPLTPGMRAGLKAKIAERMKVDPEFKKRVEAMKASKTKDHN